MDCHVRGGGRKNVWLFASTVNDDLSEEKQAIFKKV